MNKISVSPSEKKRTYVILQDPETRKSRQITLYGVTPTQAIKFIREAAERHGGNDPEPKTDAA